MAKKIGILTYHDSDNYGSVLQSYALCTYISSLGYNCEVIDYRKNEVKELYKLVKPFNSRHNILTNFFQIPYFAKLKKRKYAFEIFRKKYLHLSTKQYITNAQLKNTNYDIYIVGSDQVWNVDLPDFDTSYFLDFTSKRKFSYAASFGSHFQNPKKLLEYKYLFDDFEKVTIREKSGKNICENILNISADLVCDPVFLLDADEWRKIASPNKISEDFIFCYFAGGVSKEMEEFSKKLAKDNNCKRIIVSFDWHDWNNTNPVKKYETGPMEFVSFIDNAKFVCTNSFHGSAFSTIFSKQFFVENDHIDDRISTLLDLTDKGCRINDINNNNKNISKEKLYNLIDFSKNIIIDEVKR